MDNVLILTIILIFVTALISNVITQRRRDRVLREMQGFHITMQRQDGTQVWGEMRVYANGLELCYLNPYRTRDGEITNSFIIHQDDMDGIRLFYRFHNELSEINQVRRKIEVKHTINPGWFSVSARSARNWLNAFNDAINEALGVFISRMKGAAPRFVQQQDEYLKKMGSSALGLMGTVYNPILERYVNKRVLVIVEQDGKRNVFAGFLKEYSPAWMSLLDCRVRQKDYLNLTDVHRVSLQRNIDIEIFLLEEEGGVIMDLVIYNYGVHKLKLIAIEGSKDSYDYYRKINQTIERNCSFSFRLHDLPDTLTTHVNRAVLPQEFSLVAPERAAAVDTENNEVYQNLLPDIKLVFYTERIADVYIPRSIGVLRNSADFSV